MLLLKSCILVALLCISYVAAADKLGVDQFKAKLNSADTADKLKALAKEVFNEKFVNECYKEFNQDFLNAYAEYLGTLDAKVVTEYLAGLYNRDIIIRGGGGETVLKVPSNKVLNDIFVAETTPPLLKDIFLDFFKPQPEYDNFASYMDGVKCASLEDLSNISEGIPDIAKFVKENIATFASKPKDSCFANIYGRVFQKNRTIALEKFGEVAEELLKDSDVKEKLLNAATLKDSVLYVALNIALSEVSSNDYKGLPENMRIISFLIYGSTLPLKDGNYELTEDDLKNILKSPKMDSYEGDIEILWKSILKDMDESKKKEFMEKVTKPGMLLKPVHKILGFYLKEVSSNDYKGLPENIQITSFLIYGSTLPLKEEENYKLTKDDLERILALPKMDSYKADIKNIYWEGTLKDKVDEKLEFVKKVIETNATPEQKRHLSSLLTSKEYNSASSDPSKELQGYILLSLPEPKHPVYRGMEEEPFTRAVGSCKGSKEDERKIESLTKALEENNLKIGDGVVYKKGEDGVATVKAPSSYTIDKLIKDNAESDKKWSKEFVLILQQLKPHIAPMANEVFKALTPNGKYDVFVDGGAINYKIYEEVKKEEVKEIVQVINEGSFSKGEWEKVVGMLTTNGITLKNLSESDLDELLKEVEADTDKSKENFLQSMKKLLPTKLPSSPEDDEEFATSIFSMSAGSFAAAVLAMTLTAFFL